MGAVENLITDKLPIWSSSVQSKSSAGRGTSSKRKLYGVKKLRELILDLAVRGLLVPQDSNDEPASVLLEKIADEKERLVKDGKIKKDKAMLPITNEADTYTIPGGWILSRMGGFGFTNIGLTYKPTNVGDNGTPVLRSSNIQQGKIDLKDLVRVSGPDIKPSAMVAVGDLIICARNGSKALVGKTAQIKVLSEPMAFGAFMAIFRSDLNEYVEIFLNSPLFRRELDGVDTTTINQITQNNLKNTLIPIPPLAEQHRIVAKVDELMALCDTLEQQQEDSIQAHETLVKTLLDTLISAADTDAFQTAWQRISDHFDVLFTTEHSIDKLKETVLQLAVMGKLVPQNPNDEPASVLLNKIAAEKDRLIKNKKIRKQKVLGEISVEEAQYQIPSNWIWVRLNDIGDWGAGATPPRGRSELYGGNIPWFKSGELTGDFISHSEETVTELALQESSLRLNSIGDVLLAMYGATIGKAAILSVSGTTNQAVCACTVFTGVSNIFLLTLLKGYRPRFLAMGVGGAQPNISREKIIVTPVALPPLAEQHRIVAKVDELMTLCDQLKESLQQAQQTQIHLADAVVENAL